MRHPDPGTLISGSRPPAPTCYARRPATLVKHPGWARRGSGGILDCGCVPGGASSSTRPGVSRGRNTAELWQQRQPAATTEYSDKASRPSRGALHPTKACTRRSGRGPSPGSSRCVATARSSLSPLAWNEAARRFTQVAADHCRCGRHLGKPPPVAAKRKRGPRGAHADHLTFCGGTVGRPGRT